MAARSSLPVTQKSLMGSISKASFCVAFMLLGACTTIQSENNTARQSIGATTSTQSHGAGLDPIAAAAFWGTRYDREAGDPEVAVSYTSALRKIGSRVEAMKVISKTAEQNPDNPDVLFEYGKVLIEDNRAFEAVRHLEYAQKSLPDSWQILSAYGVALDQIGEHDAALVKYNRALAIAPTAVSVMNNKGLSYALAGKLKLAENVLMQASGEYRANAKIRQNLALVAALKGDIDKASRLARSDLPPQVADNNIAYFRSLLSQPAYWQDFAASEIDAPSFDEPVLADESAFEAEADVPEVLFEEKSFETPNADPVPLELEPLLEEELEEELEDVGAPLVLGPALSPSSASVETFTEEVADEASEESVEDVMTLEDFSRLNSLLEEQSNLDLLDETAEESTNEENDG